MMEEIEEQIDDELVADEDAEAEEADEAAAAATAAPAPKDAADGEVESIEELIVKKEAQAGEDDDDDDTVLSLTREDRLVEPVSEKVVPPQSSEFVCKKCYLVKHRSQLKDKARMLCRDCA
jgi:Domain of unknown function (DUF4193)